MSADFDRAQLQAIWPEARRRCPVSGIVHHQGPWSGPLEFNIVDFHHILQRHGGDPVYGSPLDASPLLRLLHRSDFVNHRYITAFLLERTKRAVDDAIRRGHYAMTDKDSAFLEIVREWELQHFPAG